VGGGGVCSVARPPAAAVNHRHTHPPFISPAPCTLGWGWAGRRLARQRPRAVIFPSMRGDAPGDEIDFWRAGWQVRRGGRQPGGRRGRVLCGVVHATSPYTLHPTPYTLYPKPYTLYPRRCEPPAKNPCIYSWSFESPDVWTAVELWGPPGGHHLDNFEAAYRGTSLIRNTPLLGPYSSILGGGAVSYERGTPVFIPSTAGAWAGTPSSSTLAPGSSRRASLPTPMARGRSTQSSR